MSELNELDLMLEQLGIERTPSIDKLIEFIAIRSSEICNQMAENCPTLREFNVELNDFVDMNADRRVAFVDCGNELEDYWNSL